MFFTGRKRPVGPERVTFDWYFTDENEEDVNVIIAATCHPAVSEKITADPYYSSEAEPAYAEISILSSSRVLTAQEEYDITEEGGEWFEEIEGEALERADDADDYAYSRYCEAKQEEARLKRYG